VAPIQIGFASPPAGPAIIDTTVQPEWIRTRLRAD
jgi:hypothetical protein